MKQLELNLYRDNTQNPFLVFCQANLQIANYEIPVGNLGKLSEQSGAIAKFLGERNYKGKILLTSQRPETDTRYTRLSQRYLEIICKQLKKHKIKARLKK